MWKSPVIYVLYMILFIPCHIMVDLYNVYVRCIYVGKFCIALQFCIITCSTVRPI